MTDLRSINRSAVLTELLASSPTTRVAIAAATGLSGATVTRVIDSLVEEGLARELELLPPNGRGRRAVLMEAVADQTLAVGIDLGASNTRIVVMDLLGDLVLTDRVPTPADLSTSELAAWLSSLAHDRVAGIWKAVAGFAVGLPGAVNPTTRSITNAPHLAQIEDPAFLIKLENALGMTIDIDNDANYALLGEQYFGAARSASNSVMFTLGAGLGAGVMVDGRLMRGTNGLVGEFGSLPVGPLGSRLEHMVTGPGIMFRASELGIRLQSPADLFQNTSDEKVQMLRRQFEQGLLIAITAAVVSADPEIVVLGGGIAASLHGTLDFLSRSLTQNLRTAPSIAIAELGDLSGALGAGVQGLHRAYSDLGIPHQELARIPSPRRPDGAHLAHMG
jgi:predicted NBD/HSP70 family sugar kinase